MWLNACGKLPSSSPVAGSTSSDEQPDVVRATGDALEQGACPVDLAGQREALGEPERADAERALGAGQAVFVEVPEHEPCSSVSRSATASIVARIRGSVGREEADERHHQHRRVEIVAAERLRERADRVAPTLGLDRVADCVAVLGPARDALARRHRALGASFTARSSATQFISLE